MPAKPKTVDEYLAPLAPADRAALEKVRRAMREAAPDATEVISYAMPGIRTTMVLAWYAAFPNHLSVFARPNILDAIPAAKKYRATKSALHFTAKKPIPLTLVKQIVKAQLAEADAKAAKKPKRAKAAAKSPPKKATKGDVDALLAARKHLREKDVQALRKLIRGAAPALEERWKWNAPSYHVGGEDLAAFNLWKDDVVQLVLLFRHGVPKDAPAWLEGEWKDRRIANFANAKEIRTRKAELQALLRQMAAGAGGAPVKPARKAPRPRPAAAPARTRRPAARRTTRTSR